MEIAQTQGDFRFFDEVLHKCQNAFDTRMRMIGAKVMIGHTPESLEEARRIVEAHPASTATLKENLKMKEADRHSPVDVATAIQPGHPRGKKH